MRPEISRIKEVRMPINMKISKIFGNSRRITSDQTRLDRVVNGMGFIGIGFQVPNDRFSGTFGNADDGVCPPAYINKERFTRIDLIRGKELRVFSVLQVMNEGNGRTGLLQRLRTGVHADDGAFHGNAAAGTSISSVILVQSGSERVNFW
jgi:hypothetical protein